MSKWFSRLFPLFLLTIWIAGCQTSEPPPDEPEIILPTQVTLAQPPPTSPILTATPPATLTPQPTSSPTPTSQPSPTATIPPQPTATEITWAGQSTYGASVQRLPLTSFRFGLGPDTYLFVGGIHGGYEWNSIALAYELIDYINANPEIIPDTATVYIIPSANPDGQFTVSGQTGRLSAADIPPGIDTRWGRFNANGVDLNRNWACDWQQQAYWRDQIVSGGDAPIF